MLSADEYRAFEAKARREAEEYREDAEQSQPERQALLLRWAKNRDADADFYAVKAWYADRRRPVHYREAAE